MYLCDALFWPLYSIYVYKLTHIFTSTRVHARMTGKLPGAPKKGHPTSVRYFISVYNELLHKIYIDILALGLSVICAKNG